MPIAGFGWFNGNTSEYDLQKELKTIRVDRDLTIGAATVQSVISQHAKSRKQFKKNKLQWRCSGGAKRALGWIPFKAAGIKLLNGQIRCCGELFGLWDSYDLSKYTLGTGSFSQDARGRWYFNVTVPVNVQPSAGTSAVGIDLGWKEAATTSTGETITGRFYRASEEKLGIAQRANQKNRVRAIHAKVIHGRPHLPSFHLMILSR